MQLINFQLSRYSFHFLVNEIFDLSEKKKTNYICVANVHMFIEAQNDLAFLKIINEADLVTPDGKPLCLALKWLYGISQERAAGMDLLPVLLQESERKKVKVGFYGYTEEGLEVVKQKCQKLYPNLIEPLFISPPFRTLSQKEQEEYITQMNKAEIELLFVALGCPKQEKWMASMKGQIQATMIGIGGALPVFAGLQKRAPNWMQDASLEWLFRLSQEPKRLFKRYFITNSLFIYLIVKEKFKLSIFPRHKKSVLQNSRTL
ncbi:WecB/TagA/CpsF family glycosyltransferase [uncultured Arcticibacterium sp.]|uniref:WecB/TagA/CpsF family glycosyltransferase n=1 Tax=uncultured Arcticibacterium sp. TaxID=2173042 RepID=UPI0030F65888